METRSVIDLEDIIAVEFECASCHSIFTVPVAEYKRNTYQCPQCNQSWFPSIHGDADIAVNQLMVYIKDVGNRVKSKDAPFGMAIRFRIKADSPTSV